LTDILSIQNPLVFGRATRAKTNVSALATDLGLKDRWAVEVAAMLSPIGTVTLPQETVEKLYEGKPLAPNEQAMVKRLPAVTDQLLANIPRLEPVREILTHKELRFDGEGGGKKGAEIPVGARLLKIVLDHDVLEAQGSSAAVRNDTCQRLARTFSTRFERSAASRSSHSISRTCCVWPANSPYPGAIQPPSNWPRSRCCSREPSSRAWSRPTRPPTSRSTSTP